jgi:hypothetical protein
VTIRLSALGVLVLSAAVVAVAPAAADPSNKNSIEVTLNCPGQTLTGITIEHNNASSSRSTASTSSPSRR